MNRTNCLLASAAFLCIVAGCGNAPTETEASEQSAITFAATPNTSVELTGPSGSGLSCTLLPNQACTSATTAGLSFSCTASASNTTSWELSLENLQGGEIQSSISPGATETYTVNYTTNGIPHNVPIAVCGVPASETPNFDPPCGPAVEVQAAINSCAPSPPNCTYTATPIEGTADVSVSCNPGSPEFPIYVFEEVNGAWQNVDTFSGATPPSPSFFEVPATANSYVSFLACSAPGSTDTAPVGPGDLGCDSSAAVVHVAVSGGGSSSGGVGSSSGSGSGGSSSGGVTRCPCGGVSPHCRICE